MERLALKTLALILALATLVVSAGCKEGTTGTPTPKPGLVIDGIDVSTLAKKDVTIVSHFDPGIGREKTSFGAAAKWWKDNVGGNVELKVIAADIYPTKVMAMIGAGSSPDIVMVDSRGWMPRLAVLNILQPVDDLVDLDTFQDYEKRLVDYYMWKGKHFAAYVAGAWGYSLWYNKTLFVNNGLKTPREYWDEGNWNWDTFLEVAQELTQDTDKDGKTDQWGYANWGVEVFPAANMAFMTKTTEDGKVQVIWDEKPFVDAAQFEQDLINKYKVWAPDLGFHVQGFKAGKVAMSAGANDFVKQFCAGMKDEVDNAPFPLGPAMDKDDIQYIGYSLFLGYATGAPNLDGARAYIGKMRAFNKQFTAENVVDPDSNFAVLTQEQIDTCNFVDSKVILNYESGFGDWENKRWGFWGDILFQSVPVATALQMHRPTLEAEIKATLESKFVEIEKFVPVPAETFESNDLAKIQLTQQGLEGGTPNIAMTLVTTGALDGTTSLRFEYPAADEWSLIVRTDETKVRLPSYHRYVIKFNYQVEADGPVDLYLTIRPKATVNSDEVSYGFLKVPCEIGKKATFEGYIDVLDQSEDNVLVLIGQNRAFSITIDEFGITEG